MNMVARQCMSSFLLKFLIWLENCPSGIVAADVGGQSLLAKVCPTQCWWSPLAKVCPSDIGQSPMSIPLLVVQPIGKVCPSDTVHCPFQPIAMVFPTHFPPDGHEVVAACQTSLCVFESKLQLQLPSADCRSNFSEPILKYFIIG